MQKRCVLLKVTAVNKIRRREFYCSFDVPKEMTHWKMKDPQMVLQVIMRMIKTFQVKCQILMMKKLVMLISLV
jgi:hypothetical protein